MSYLSTQRYQLRLNGHRQRVSIHGTKLTFAGVDYPCEAPEQERILQMQAANYDEQIPAEFSMEAKLFTDSGMTNRSKFQHNGKTFELYAIVSDTSEPTVRLRANLKQ